MADEPGTFYYNCVVTNTNKNVSGSKDCFRAKRHREVNVVAPAGVTDAMAPRPDSAVLSDATYGLGARADELRYDAFVDDGACFRTNVRSTDETSAGTAIDGAVQSTFVPPADEAGTFYYYCVATTPTSMLPKTRRRKAPQTGRRSYRGCNRLRPITASACQRVLQRRRRGEPLAVEGRGAGSCRLTYQWYDDHTGEGAAIDRCTQILLHRLPTKTGYISYHCRITASYARRPGR